MSARTIVLDIETYRTRSEAAIARLRQEAAEKEPPKTAAKDDKGLWHSEAAREKRFREALDKTAVDPLLAEILCVVFALDNDVLTYFCGTQEADNDERGMLVNVAREWSRAANGETVWVGHNISGFDLPVLLNRFRYHGIKPPEAFPVFEDGRWRGRIFDTMKRIPGKTPFISMEAACESVGVPLLPVMWRGEPMHGGRVAACYEAGDWDVVLSYCTQDVLASRLLYKALTFNDSWGVHPAPNDLASRIEELEANPNLTEAQKAITQKALLKSAGAWPR